MLILSKIEFLEEFEQNPLFQQFLQEDVDVRSVTSSAVQCSAVAEQLAQLGAGISLLDKALRHQVAGHYEDLLSQATEIETLEGVLLDVSERMSTLLNCANRLRSRVGQPYEKIVQLTSQLRRLHAVCDMLRKVTLVLRTSQRLQDALMTDQTKAVAYLDELETILEETDLTGIDIIDSELQNVENAKAILRNKS